MPLRVVCPSCSTQLSVRDEFAGRAVKCPKCGGVIPPGPSPDAPPAEAPKPSPEQIDAAFQAFGGSPSEPAPTPPSSASSDDAPEPRSRPTAASARPKAEPVGADRPRRPGTRPRDDDEDDRPGRPRRRPGRDDDEDDDDRPRRRPRSASVERSGGGGAGKVLAIVGVVMLLLCGGIGFGIYWMVMKVKDSVEKAQKQFEEEMNPATQAKYDQVRIGAPRTEVEGQLYYDHRPATEADLKKAFRGDDAKLIPDWESKVKKGRVLVWQRNEDYLFVAFHPNADATGRVQLKAFMPAAGPTAHAGTADDKKYAEEQGLDQKGTTDPDGPAESVTAEALAKAYGGNRGAADAKYANKAVFVEGEIVTLVPEGASGLYVHLKGTPVAGKGTKVSKGGLTVRCAVLQEDVNQVLNHTPGQTLRLKGKVSGLGGAFVDVYDCQFDSHGPDPAVTTTAGGLVAEYTKNESAADARFKGKTVVVTDALVGELVEDERAIILTPAVKKGMPTKIKVTFGEEWEDWFKKYKRGDKIRVRGTCVGLQDDMIQIDKAWPVPGN
jgi:predicted Zn finger-like uncharacterized protein